MAAAISFDLAERDPACPTRGRVSRKEKPQLRQNQGDARLQKIRTMGTVKPEWVPPLNACLHKCQNPCHLQGRRSPRWRLHEPCCLLPRIWHSISECSRGLIQNSTLPFGLVTNCSLNSVYPLSLAARKNACKVEWWLSVNRDDLLLISTLHLKSGNALNLSPLF